MGSIERERLADLRDAMDRRGSSNIGTARQLVRVFDGGSMPSTVPAVYLGHPTSIGVDESEGSTPTYTPDTGIAIPVLVLGPRVPVVDDLLLATAVGGRWVAGRGGTTQTCSPCSIPEHNLTATETGVSGTPSVFTLTYSPLSGGTWTGVAPFSGWTYILHCLEGQVVLTAFSDFEIEIGTSRLDYTCDPFHFHFSVHSGTIELYVDE